MTYGLSVVIGLCTATVVVCYGSVLGLAQDQELGVCRNSWTPVKEWFGTAGRTRGDADFSDLGVTGADGKV
ncbi:hypothetical protein NL676_006670 [Syzygium grande]|nr:hypothetical protein NL676_006670 [Syzygium grande]